MIDKKLILFTMNSLFTRINILDFFLAKFCYKKGRQDTLIFFFKKLIQKHGL